MTFLKLIFAESLKFFFMWNLLGTVKGKKNETLLWRDFTAHPWGMQRSIFPLFVLGSQQYTFPKTDI